MKFVLGSQAVVKGRALKMARDKLGLSRCPVVYTAGASGVSKQPSSELETLHGALNRVNSLVELWRGCFIVAVENGIALSDRGWHDHAYVVVRDPEGVMTIRRSQQVKVPYELAEKSCASSWTKTCGALEAERSGCDPQDPHVVWAGKSREDILAEVLEEALGVAVDSWQKKRRREVTVSFGDHSAKLPVREVSPGVSVALLELYRDPDLTETLGKVLASIASDLNYNDVSSEPFDFVLSPDGKAQALLHVFCRELGLTPILARKERKSYMDEPVVSATTESATTKTPHTFYLGAEDAECLRGKNVVILDDVVSGGGTVEAMKELLKKCGAKGHQVVTVATEGERRSDVISLAHLEVYK